jgi:hypothetical protein
MLRSAKFSVWPFAAAVALGAALSSGGCTDYLHHRETISLHTGEAAQANIAIHTIDPWPQHAYDSRIRYSGQRLRHGQERYNSGPDEGKKVTAQPIILAPIGAPAPAN